LFSAAASALLEEQRRAWLFRRGVPVGSTILDIRKALQPAQITSDGAQATELTPRLGTARSL
jgi:hypothetical protein